MADAIETFMSGLEARLKTIPGLRVAEFVPDQVNPPQVFFEVPDVPDYNEAYARGKYSLETTITLLTSKAWTRTGQKAHAAYASLSSPKSIFAAINADPTLGGAAEAVQVTSSQNLGIEAVGLIGYYGRVFNLRVMLKEASP